jgi:hypothetical protein
MRMHIYIGFMIEHVLCMTDLYIQCHNSSVKRNSGLRICMTDRITSPAYDWLNICCILVSLARYRSRTWTFRRIRFFRGKKGNLRALERTSFHSKEGRQVMTVASLEASGRRNGMRYT